MTPKKLMEVIIEILAQYPTLKDMPAGEWNRIEAIIKQAKSEWCKEQKANCVQAYYDDCMKPSGKQIGGLAAIAETTEPDNCQTLKNTPNGKEIY